MGDVTSIPSDFEETKMFDEKGKEVSVVKVFFQMNNKVEEGIYQYLTTDSE